MEEMTHGVSYDAKQRRKEQHKKRRREAKANRMLVLEDPELLKIFKKVVGHAPLRQTSLNKVKE